MMRLQGRFQSVQSDRFIAMVFMLFVLVCPMSSFAAENTKIAVVNIQDIMGKSKAAKSIQSQIETQKKSYQDEFSKHERNFVEEAKVLSDSRADMKPEEFAKKKQEFDNKLLETQKLAKKRQQALEVAAAEALGVLRDEVIKIVTDISEKEHYDLVVTQQNIIWGRKDIEITDIVMARLDKSLKQITLNIKED